MKFIAKPLASTQMMALKEAKMIVVKVILPGAILLRFKPPFCPLITVCSLLPLKSCVIQFFSTVKQEYYCCNQKTTTMYIHVYRAVMADL